MTAPHPVGAGEFVEQLDSLLGVYRGAMGYTPEQAEHRWPVWAEDCQRPGFSCVVARDELGAPAAFAYGYTGQPGQWWHDEVARGVNGTPAVQWLADYAELAEVHVQPDHQGRGLGERTLRSWIGTSTESRVLLSVLESTAPTAAWRLYRRLGFRDVLRHYRFTGDPRAFGVLGRDSSEAPLS